MTKKQSIFHRIHGADSWCVPSALSALTGLSTDTFRVMQLGIEGRGRGMWQGIRSATTEKMLKSMGIDFERTKITASGAQGRTAMARSRRYGTSAAMTFNQWCAGRKGYYIVAAGHHMLLFRDGMVVDNGYAAEKKPIHYTQVRAKRARMNYALKVENKDWHESGVAAPSWAVEAAAKLFEARVLNGKSAKIKVAEILKIKREHEARPKVAPKPVPGKPRCSRCEKDAKCRGLCSGCYKKARRAGEFGGKVCSEDGCNRIAEVKGLCHRCSHRLVFNPNRRKKQ